MKSIQAAVLNDIIIIDLVIKMFLLINKNFKPVDMSLRL